MSMIVWHNGQLLEEDAVSISAFDPAFSGMGAFETLLAVNGRLFVWERHRSRLVSSLEKLSIPTPEMDGLEEVMREVLFRNQLDDGEARVRVTMTGNLTGVKTTLITAVAFEGYLEAAQVVTAEVPINEQNPLRQAKTLSYASNWMQLQHAKAQGADEILVPNTMGNLAEASMSNVFFVHKGQLKTPSLQSGCLPGITRELILEIAPEAQEGGWSMALLEDAEEVWLSSSLRRLQWVKTLNGREMGEPSSRFLEVRRVLDKRITQETSAP